MLLGVGGLEGARAALAEWRGRLRARREETAREEAQVARLGLRYREAADLYEEAARLAAFDPEAAWQHALDAAGALYDQRNEFGDNEALREAIAGSGRALALASREARPFDWAMTQMNLGNALQVLGAREAGTGRLDEAAVAFDAYLKVTVSVWPEAWFAEVHGPRAAAFDLLAKRRGRINGG